MTDKIVILSTCPTKEEADRIASMLIDKRLAACVQVVSGIESTYRWKGAVERSTEYLLIVKSTRPLFEKIESELVRAHSYDLPELLALPVVEGLSDYLRWIDQQVDSAGE